MGLNSKIEWCDHTANLWHGCTKVHEGCDHCYAETQSIRWGKDIWGNDKPRLMIQSVWTKLKECQRLAAQAGEMQTVFVGSMMDIFEKQMPLVDHKGNMVTDGMHYYPAHTGQLRDQLFEEITDGKYPNLMFLLLTKRPSNINKYIPESWKENPPHNVMFGTSPVNQQTYDTLWLQLARVNGKRFLSIEPQLDQVWIKSYCPSCDRLLLNSSSPTCGTCHTPTVMPEWIIQGGESGHGRRPFDLEWADSLRVQCAVAGVAYFFKQIDKVMPVPEDLKKREYPPYWKHLKLITDNRR